MGSLAKNIYVVTSTKSKSTNIYTIKTISSNILEFHFNYESNLTLNVWFGHYQNLFWIEFCGQTEYWKVQILLGKLWLVEHNYYSNFLKTPCNFSFDQIVYTSKQIFDEQSS